MALLLLYNHSTSLCWNESKVNLPIDAQFSSESRSTLLNGVYCPVLSPAKSIERVNYSRLCSSLRVNERSDGKPNCVASWVIRDSTTLYVGVPEEQTRLKTQPAYLLEHLKHLFLSEQFEALNNSVSQRCRSLRWTELNDSVQFGDSWCSWIVLYC